ncbi:aldehyde dehydrogenase family protein [Alicyclobacillus curvatus]|nr:aldehyde dehydrogenase family protein [Alicyclobacillus curvatus]
MFIGGRWVHSDDVVHVYDPQDNTLIDTVPAASKQQALKALELGETGARVAERMPTHERISVLSKAARYIEENFEEYALVIARESSKTIREARKEVGRCIETLKLSAEEARRLQGETIQFDQTASGEGRTGYFYRFPVGLIVAITPFNDPLNLVAHKVGPAIAGGNAIIVKPALTTPLSALKLAEAFEAAGLPENVLTVITGRASEIGETLTTHPAVRMVTFTGGLETGQRIARQCGLKKLSMELGSNSPVIVLKDALLDDAVEACVSGAFWAAGQNCLGVQRIFVEESVYSQFVDELVARTGKMQLGDKLREGTDMGPLILEQEACRVEEWVSEAVSCGATVKIGGTRRGNYYEPTILTDVPIRCRIAKDEVFGPVVSVFPVANLDEAIALANDVDYGLQAGVFTENIEKAFQAVHRLKVGGVLINDSTDYRLDAMPFGGVKGSGIGREGVKFALQEMTEPKVVCFKLGLRH